MLICPACGQENPEGFRFCGSCGKPVTDEIRRPREERKVVTVLFADLVGFTGRAEQLDPEDVRAMLSPYYARLRSELERRGGTVEKFIGDAVMAVFGAPMAHEDDPERAVRAALAIRDAIRDEDAGLQVRIAVNTGEALVSLDARPSAGEGMAAGDVVNTTARLQSAAPVNGILVGESTYRSTRHAIEYREAAPVEAKGKADPVQVWEVVQAYSRIAVETLETGAPLIGRRRELDVLTGALERARQERTPQLVTLVGVPGIGKSRLVYELFKAIESEPDLVFWRQGRALPYGEGVTYWALAEMVKAHAGVLETDSLADVGQKLTQAVSVVLGESPEAEWVELHLRLLVGLTTSTDMSGDRRAESFAAWRRFFEALAEQNPLVLVFDDLHWADDDLLDFVDHLVDWASSVPILVVCAARPELLDRRPAWGGGKLNAATVSVTPLSDEETAELIGALLERILLPAEIQATLLAHADGNPLYAEQFVRMHLERAGDAPALPETVQGIIAARLDILPAAEKALLQDAAVMGKVFWLGAAAAIGELGPDAVETLLHALERKDFIRRERRSSVAGETEYSFRHVLVQDVAYAQIPRAARAEKHRVAAGWIDSLSDDRADDRAEMLAHHYLASLEFARAAGSETDDLRERARLALRVAAERAMALSAFAAAARFFESALELWPADDAERPKLLLRCGEALYTSRGAGIEFLEEARDASLGAGMVEEAAEAEALLGQLRYDQGLPDEALGHMDRAVALIEDRAASAAKASVYAQAARWKALTGNRTEAIRLSDAALALGDELQLLDATAYTLNTRGMVRVIGGDLGGIEDLEASIVVAGERRPADLARGYGNLASMQVDLGNLTRGRELHERGLEAASRMGQENDVRWLDAELSCDRFLAGEWNEALRGFDLRIAESATSPFFMEAPCRGLRALIRLARGNFAGALEDCERGLALGASSRGDSQTFLPILAKAALCRLETGDEGRAGSLADRLVEIKSRALLAHSWFLELTFVLVGLGRSAEVGPAAAGFPTPTLWLEVATSYAAGDPLAAAEMLFSMGARPYEAYVRLRAAEELVALGRRSEADQELRRTLDFWHAVGASTYVRRGEALLPASA
ncbi:MAG TPA: AAA family ATPase [Gaiellaceae bacterium]|jgi:class 3 adenylate cyclase/tetratricopeptide (TPR) repeat protein|nr:AAA family ATPase [Gaiellaceae bacterium]